MSDKSDIVLTHDGARPFLREELILKGINGAIEFGACVIGVPVKDTIKVVNENNQVHHTPNRALLWAAQTPQCFKTDILKKGYEYASKESIVATDDSSLVEKYGHPVKMIMGSYDNIKITTPDDLIIAESIFKNMNLNENNDGFGGVL